MLALLAKLAKLAQLAVALPVCGGYLYLDLATCYKSKRGKQSIGVG